MKTVKVAFLVFSFFCVAFNNCYSQELDSIKKVYWPIIGTVFKYNNSYHLPFEARKVMLNNSDAHAEMIKAKRRGFNRILIGAGNGLIIYSLVDGFANEKKFSYPLIISGVALIGIGIPIGISQERHFRNAVNIYNKSL